MHLTFFKKNWLIILLYLTGFWYTLAVLSNRFDGDFGWQLRFGQEVLSGHFPYLDSYTWSYFGRPWINHEWGGSTLWWIIYHYLSYNALVVFVALIAWSTFALTPRAVGRTLTPLSLACSLFGIYAANAVLYTRLTVIAPAFFLLLVYTLERIPKKKYYYWWPILFWVWAALHGSWILGFIVITIYLAGKIMEVPVAYWSNRLLKITLPVQPWNKTIYLPIVFTALVSALLITLNPYGLDLWREVLTYFSQTYYMAYITEWQPAYVFPILVLPLIVSAITVTLALYAYSRGKISLSQLLLLLALHYTAFSHKRNIIYAMLASVPLLYAVLLSMGNTLTSTNARWNKNLQQWSPAVVAFLLAITVGSTLPTVLWHSNVWQETHFLEREGFPAIATQKLQSIANTRSLVLFDQFRWGGFFNWQLPTVPVYIDGRGTVSWALHPPKTLYAEYRDLLYEPAGLTKLQTDGVNAILLEQPGAQVFASDFSNKLLFSSNALATVTTPVKTALEKSLDASTAWEKIYSDSLAQIWVRR